MEGGPGRVPSAGFDPPSARSIRVAGIRDATASSRAARLRRPLLYPASWLPVFATRSIVGFRSFLQFAGQSRCLFDPVLRLQPVGDLAEVGYNVGRRVLGGHLDRDPNSPGTTVALLGRHPS